MQAVAQFVSVTQDYLCLRPSSQPPMSSPIPPSHNNDTAPDFFPPAEGGGTMLDASAGLGEPLNVSGEHGKQSVLLINFR